MADVISAFIIALFLIVTLPIIVTLPMLLASLLFTGIGAADWVRQRLARRRLMRGLDELLREES